MKLIRAEEVLKKVKEVEERYTAVEKRYEELITDLIDKTKSQTVFEYLAGKTKTTPITTFFINSEEEEENIRDLIDYLKARGYYTTLKIKKDNKKTYVIRVYLEEE